MIQSTEPRILQLVGWHIRPAPGSRGYKEWVQAGLDKAVDLGRILRFLRADGIEVYAKLESQRPRSKFERYTEAQKLAVLAYAARTSKRAAHRRFGVCRARVIKWAKERA